MPAKGQEQTVALLAGICQSFGVDGADHPESTKLCVHAPECEIEEAYKAQDEKYTSIRIESVAKKAYARDQFQRPPNEPRSNSLREFLQVLQVSLFCCSQVLIVHLKRTHNKGYATIKNKIAVVCSGSFPVAEYTSAERLPWAAQRPVIAIVPILAIVIVRIHRKRSLNGVHPNDC